MGLNDWMSKKNDQSFQKLYDRLYDHAWRVSGTADPVRRHFEADFYARAQGSPYASNDQLARYETEAAIRHASRVTADPAEFFRRLVTDQWRVCFESEFTLVRAASANYSTNPLQQAAWTFRWCSGWANSSASLLRVEPGATLHKSLLDDSLARTGEAFGVEPGHIYQWLLANRPEVSTDDLTEQLRRWARETSGEETRH